MACFLVYHLVYTFYSFNKTEDKQVNVNYFFHRFNRLTNHISHVHLGIFVEMFQIEQ